MANRQRGEIEAVLDGRTWTLCLTLGALAELEAALGAGDLLELAKRRRGARGRPTQGWSSLTPTERAVIGEVASGATNAEIGNQLSLSPNTIKQHASALYRKLGARNRPEAVRRAQRLGLIG